jgi:hydrophobe/amphiphile efflux-3 (HAE3) family protein
MKKELFVIKYRWPILIGCIIVTALMGLELRKIQIEPNSAELMPPTMSSRMNTTRLEELFGSNDMLFYLLEAPDVLSEPTLQRVKALASAFRGISGVKDVMSVFEAKRIMGQDGAMIVEPAIGTIPASYAERETLRQQLLENELVKEVVISKDFRYTAIILSLKLGASQPDVFKAADSIVKSIPGTEKVYVGGVPAFQHMIIKDIVKDLFFLIPTVLLVMLVILYGFFRQRRGVLLPFFVVVLSTIFGMAVLPIMGWKITVLSAILPIMVVAFSNNYGLYLIARYKELCAQQPTWTPKELASEVFRSLSKPILFTGLITMVGILGLLTHILVPAKQIGIAAAAAIGFSIIVTLGGIPAILSLLRVPKAPQSTGGSKSWSVLDKGLSGTARLVTRRPAAVLIVTLIVTALGVAGALMLKVDANQENLFSKRHPISQSTRLINSQFGGSQTISLLVEGDIKDPALLNRLQVYKDTLTRMPGVGQVASMADVIKTMSKALNDKGEPGYNRIPDTRDAVAQYLELYSMSGNPEDFERLVDFNYEKTQFLVRVNNGATPAVNTIMAKIREIQKQDPGIKLIGGYAAIFSELANTIIKGQVESILFALGAIIILVILLFRSPVAGALSAVPLVISIVMGFGLMGTTGIRLDIATAVITSIVMGTGVDFTIQLLWGYRSVRRSGVAYAEAIHRTLTTTGKAVTFNALCVIAGFGVLFLSSMPPLRSLALLFCVLTLTCMVATLVVIPALCLVFKPKFLDPPSTPKQEVPNA